MPDWTIEPVGFPGFYKVRSTKNAREFKVYRFPNGVVHFRNNHRATADACSCRNHAQGKQCNHKAIAAIIGAEVPESA